MLGKFYVGDMESASHGELPAYQKAHRELVNKFHEAGLYETDYSFYARRAALMACFIGLGVYFALVQQNVFASAIFVAAFWQQAAFIGHDAGHTGITHNRKWDNIIGLFAGNVCNGIGISWWKNTHNVHHIVTNSADHDPDIQHLPVFAISDTFFGSLFSQYHSATMVFDKTTQLFVSYQHWYWIPMMMLAKWSLYGQSIAFLATAKSYVPIKYEVATLVAYYTWFFTLANQFPFIYQKVGFVMLAHMAFGILHLQITCSHWAMETYTGLPDDGEFLKKQLDGTMNWSCPRWMDWFHGGLHFQVEHHCFPRMPRHNLRYVSTILEPLCKEHGLSYRSPSFSGIIYETYVIMKRAAMKAREVNKFNTHVEKKFSFIGATT